jgi:hypothetical protein
MIIAAIIFAAFVAGFTRNGEPLSTKVERGEISPVVAVLATVIIVAATVLSFTEHTIPDWFGQMALALIAGGVGGEVRARVATKRKQTP